MANCRKIYKGHCGICRKWLGAEAATKRGSRSLNLFILSETLAGADGWFLPEATTDTWYPTQMVN